MRFCYSILLTIAFSCLIVISYASPAYPGLIKKQQPDGSTVSLYLKGDEKIHWMESEDGYSLLYDRNKNIVYAVLDEQNNMIPSSFVVRDVTLRSSETNTFLRNIPKKLYYSPAQINTLKSIWKMTQNVSAQSAPELRATTGTVRAICTLINFKNKSLIKTRAEFENLMNQTGYSAAGAKGSVHDYYLENSYGKLNLVITVAGPYTVSRNWEYYGENDSADNGNDKHPQEMAIEAADFTFKDPAIRPADYDNDNDGFIDAFHIIYAGYGEEAGADANSIWAHKYEFPARSYGNKKLNVYSCSPELRENSKTNTSNITNIGVICHELCHIFGAPDFYDTDKADNGGDFAGTGHWDLMATGSWNDRGVSPAHINMYQKIQFGWVAPETLNQPKTITGMPNSAENAVAYRYDTPTPGEYFVLENRQKKGFDRGIPGSGLLIYHVADITNSDIRNNRVNIKHPQKVYPVCASAITNPTGTPNSYGDINSSGCPFPGSSRKTSFTDYTIPAATAWNGTNTIKPLTEIQEQQGLISFRFSMPDVDPITNFKANINGQNVQFTWNKPSNAENVTGYNIYRNNLLVIKLLDKNETSYTQYNVNPGNYSYCITALYTGIESTSVCKEVQIGGISNNNICVRNLEAKNTQSGVVLNWESPFISDWVNHADDPFSMVYYKIYTNTFTAAVRFIDEDLQNFQGSQLTKVRAVIVNTQCKHTLQVWQINKDGTPGDPIINQVLNTPKTGIVEILLNTPVPLVAGKELWIGIKYELNPLNTHVAVVDQGPMVPNRNYVFIDGRWYYTSTNSNYNWCIAGYLQFDKNFLNAPANNQLKSATATNYVVYRNNQQIATTTQSSYIDPSPSSSSPIYCVSIAYDDGKESEQTCAEVLTDWTNIQPLIAENSRIYPNPIEKGEILSIELENFNTNSMLQLYAISGQLIQQEQITGPVIRKRMDLDPGVYILQIKNSSQTIIRKIIVR